MPPDEGLALSPGGGRLRPAVRAGPRGGHLLRQVRHLSRRGRTQRSAARYSTPSTTTAGRRRTRPAGSTTTPGLVDTRARADGHSCRSFRSTLARAGLEDQVVSRGREVHDGLRRCGALPVECSSSTAGTPRRPPKPTTRAGRAGSRPGGALAIHDVFPDPRRRRPGALRHLPAGTRLRRLHRGGRARVRCGSWNALARGPDTGPSGRADRAADVRPASRHGRRRYRSGSMRIRCPVSLRSSSVARRCAWRRRARSSSLRTSRALAEAGLAHPVREVLAEGRLSFRREVVVRICSIIRRPMCTSSSSS